VSGPPRIILACVAVAVLGSCSATNPPSQAAMSALAAGTGEAAAACARTEPGTDFSMPVLASSAARDLKGSHVSPDPWATLLPDNVIVACFKQTSQGTRGVFVDQAGISTPIPPGSISGCAPAHSLTTVTEGAFTVENCSILVSSSSGTALVIDVIVGAVVVAVAVGWLLVARRSRRKIAGL
jgi:hypothetical protein